MIGKASRLLTARIFPFEPFKFLPQHLVLPSDISGLCEHPRVLTAPKSDTPLQRYSCSKVAITKDVSDRTTVPCTRQLKVVQGVSGNTGSESNTSHHFVVYLLIRSWIMSGHQDRGGQATSGVSLGTAASDTLGCYLSRDELQL